MLDFLSKGRCSGCSACASICPKSCIEMISDKDGFMYPEIVKDACINCKLCERVCPILNKPLINTITPTAGAMRTLDEKEWNNSSSGGAFYELCKAWFELYSKESVVFAARFDGLRLIHDSFTNLADILPFQKSKYIQSDIRGVFRRVKGCLSIGKHVMFVGTPCQVAGLRNYMQSDIANLLCVDFICHGVGSPGVFNSFIQSLESKKGKKIYSYEFRTKKGIFGNYGRYCSKIMYDDGKIEYYDKDSYNSIFLKQLCTRASCNGNCPFREIPRQGDITIADFNAKSIAFPDLRDEKSYSAIIYNSKKGEAFKPAIISDSKYFDCDIQHIKDYNPLLYKNVPGNADREKFMEQYSNGCDFDDLVQLAHIKRPGHLNRLLKYIPWNVKYDLHRFYHKLKK